MDYLEFIARVTSHIPEKGQVTIRYYGLYANAHRGKVRKASVGPFPLRTLEEGLRPIPSKGRAALINWGHVPNSPEFGTCPLLPMLWSRCGGKMKIIAFLTDYAVVDRIISHLKLTFTADKPPPVHLTCQEVLMPAEPSTEHPA